MSGRGQAHPVAAPSGFFVLRTPLLPFTEVTTWGHGLQAPTAGEDPGVLAEALDAARLSRSDVDLALPQRRLRAFCADRDVPCLDLLPIFAGKTDTYAPRDTHWNKQGNHLAARSLAAWPVINQLASSPRPPAP